MTLEPAEKTAVSPLTHAPVASAQVESVLQKLSVPHVPVAVVLLDPPVQVSLASQ